jgi:2-polyprenyl-6-methoxyphenol hydroxylase-like FAD-dependent oxidoreductase
MDRQVDVAVVGFGPVGQAVSTLLAESGHRVAAFERFGEIYRMPRAVHIDHEVMRILQKLRVAGALADDLLPFRDYHWYGADGDELMTLRAPAPALSGWEPDYLFFQPTLEHALEARALEAGVLLTRGVEVDALDQAADGVVLRAGEERVGARWVIGADGANSFVRHAAGIGTRDLGFQERWLVADVEPADMAALDLPAACQWCDPARPTTHVQSGTRHRRWEFMLLPGEHPASFDERRTWELLSPWFRPEDGRLLRHVVYEFRSVLAERMRAGRVLLAGDSAHLTPPFLGQGLGAGLRDAVNLAWKLDLVLRDAAPASLLDTVTAERQPQTEWVISFAIELGRALCELDPAKAAERDAAIRAGGPPPVVDMVPLAGGCLHRPANGTADPLAGRLSLQPRVELDGGSGLLDDLTGGGFTLIAREGDPLAGLEPPHVRALERLGVRAVAAGPDTDADGRLRAWLDEHAAHAVLVRPDFYAFGSAGSPAALGGLVERLATSIAVPHREETP